MYPSPLNQAWKERVHEVAANVNDTINEDEIAYCWSQQGEDSITAVLPALGSKNTGDPEPAASPNKRSRLDNAPASPIDHIEEHHAGGGGFSLAFAPSGPSTSSPTLRNDSIPLMSMNY